MSLKLQISGHNLTLTEGVGGLHKISGSVIHPCKTHNPNEWAKVRQYIEPYLEQAAPTLVGRTMIVDHVTKLSEGNVITYSIWKDGELIYEGTITEDVYKMSKSGMLKPKVSVGVDWLKPGGGLIVGEQGQVIPYAFDFSEFSLLMNMEPGDPDTNLQIWDGLMEGIIREGIEIVESVEARKRAFALEDARVRNEKLAKELALENSKETSNPFTTEVMLDPIDRLRLLVTSR